MNTGNSFNQQQLADHLERLEQLRAEYNYVAAHNWWFVIVNLTLILSGALTAITPYALFVTGCALTVAVYRDWAVRRFAKLNSTLRDLGASYVNPRVTRLTPTACRLLNVTVCALMFTTGDAVTVGGKFVVTEWTWTWITTFTVIVFVNVAGELLVNWNDADNCALTLIVGGVWSTFTLGVLTVALLFDVPEAVNFTIALDIIGAIFTTVLAIYLLVVNLNSINDELAELAIELKFLRG